MPSTYLVELRSEDGRRWYKSDVAVDGMTLGRARAGANWAKQLLCRKLERALKLDKGSVKSVTILSYMPEGGMVPKPRKPIVIQSSLPLE